MRYLRDEISIARLNLMKRRARLTEADRLACVKFEARTRSEHLNHVACTTEHMWYVARSLERIERHIGMTEEKKHPTKSGKKD